MKRSTTSLALVAVLAALLAWGLVWYLMTRASADEAALSAHYATLSRGSAQRDYDIRQHALVLSSASERTAITNSIPSSITSIVNTIDATGKASGAKVLIGTAAPASLPNSAPADLHAVEFVVQATGSFSKVLQAAYLFQDISLPSKIVEVDFEQIPDIGSTSASHLWQLTLRLQVLTSAAISS